MPPSTHSEATVTSLHEQVGGRDDRQGEDEPVEESLVDPPGEAAADHGADDDRRRQEQAEPQ